MSCPTQLRTVWLSDVHLGSRACRVDLLIDFLRNTRCETLYLVGDIIDLERMRRSFYWPESHTEVLRTILRKSQQGTRVIYIPGNHDDDFRALAGHKLGPVEVVRQHVHVTAAGKRLLVFHGDEFDRVIRSKSATSIAGSAAYSTLLAFNRLVHWWHELCGRPYWSLAQHVKSRFNKAVKYVENFERACVHAARGDGMDGVVCGHIHQAALIEEDGFTYCNDGDWVESCSAIVENAVGELSLLLWTGTASGIDVLDTPYRDAA